MFLEPLTVSLAPLTQHNTGNAASPCLEDGRRRGPVLQIEWEEAGT